MKQRVLSALTLAGIAAAAVVLNIFFGYILSAVAAAIALMCVYELYRCVEVPVGGIFFIYSAVFTVAMILCITPEYGSSLFTVKLQLAFICALIIVTVANGLASRDGMLKTVRLSLITIMIVLCFGVIAYWGTRSVYDGTGKYDVIGLNMIFITVLAPCASDTMGLIVGSAFGKHKMAPYISPKKTWEGFLGSLICAPLIVLLFGGISDAICCVFDLPYRANYLSLLITGLIGAVFGTLGDLFFSLIKRKVKIKDYGHIIPGHGGMLDRFDSFTFTSVLIFWLYTVYPQFNYVAA